MEATPTARGEPDFPVFARLWERYPSGRLLEQITMTDEAGVETCLSKATDQDGTVEYSLRKKTSVPPIQLPSAFSGGTFGLSRCHPEDFELLRQELLAFTGAINRAT